VFHYIRCCLLRAREVFGTDMHGGNPEMPLNALVRVYFDDLCRPTEPPPISDRQCHHCGHIGHYVDSCPVKHGTKTDEIG
jgi:hypothetical protein